MLHFSETYEKTDFGDIWYYSALDGNVSFALYVYDDDKTMLYLADVNVKQPYRKKGYGQYILDTANLLAVKKGFGNLTLQVLKESWMHDWYKRNGFIDLQENEDDDRFIWMEKR